MRITLKSAAVALALSLSAVVAAAPAAHASEKVVVGTSAAAKWSAIGIIGVAGVLVTYDIMRRFGCTGDFLRLGGPGFGGPVGNNAIMPPRNCAGR